MHWVPMRFREFRQQLFLDECMEINFVTNIDVNSDSSDENNSDSDHELYKNILEDDISKNTSSDT